MADARVTFDLRHGTIVVEGPSTELANLLEAVRAAAPSLKQIAIVSTDGAIEQHALTQSSNPAASVPQSMKEFARAFTTENTTARIAVLAYYAETYAHKATFSVEEMSAWFDACEFKRPAQMAVSVTDARRKYGFLESKGRGHWTLTRAGERFARDLLAARDAIY